ncbi:hypothetical protein LTR28_011516, partial [Elasticomyces elasticus]
MGLWMDSLHAPTVASGPTSRPSANGSKVPLTLGQLMDEKDRLEAELSALGSVLDSHGVNMNTSLTTFDGFPRADLDVAQIRTTRARIIELKNDYKDLMKKIETGLHEYYAAGAAVATASIPSSLQTTSARVSTTGTSSNGASASTPALEAPFAKVNSVVVASPADTAGLRAGDRITRFGSVDWMNHEKLSRVAQVVSQNEGRPILVK